MSPRVSIAVGALLSLLSLPSLGLAESASSGPAEPVWTRAWRQGPLSADETKKLMRELAQFVHEQHLKKDKDSPQRGMIYEYYDTPRRGLSDQFVQGEALDTMHDGAWFAAALVNAHRVTGEAFYRDFLTRWTLPFYLKMLNGSDKLFSARGAVLPADGKTWGKPWMFQEGEKGFVPYWWDDGGSVSLERRLKKSNVPPFMCVDETAGKDNPQCLLKGYSLGSSNHMAQDLGVMVQLAWLLLKDSPADKALAAQTAEAARNLHESRMRHHGRIPMCVAPYALSAGLAGELAKLTDDEDKTYWTPSNHYTRALVDFKADQPASAPGFADDQQYRYYYTIARSGGKLPRAFAFKLIYDAYTERMLYGCYSDDAPVPPGINSFDLHPYRFVNGKPADYRSDRKGRLGRPRPTGSRMGPQNMIMCGIALQALRAYPGLWEQRRKDHAPDDLLVPVVEPVPHAGSEQAEQAQAWSREVNADGAILEFCSGRTALRVRCGLKAGQSARFKLFGRADGQGGWADVSVGADHRVAVVNDKGEAVKTSLAAVDSSGRTRVVPLEIPYTFVKGQVPWANGIEHGRLSLRWGERTRNLYLMSGEAQVKAWLEYELGCGLRTWESVFKHMGYIPTGMGTMDRWDNYSDTGGYAHLISAGAQWLTYLGARNDWEMQGIANVR